ncbi:hypothetical protein DMN91_001957 [Ooceraea biroi]|uniref:Cationic amino acid transporter C-terminal domain-containing protein n=1 Tax=Ooceraea biroi TaxID=2015173 RepID=A0A3L8DZG2_OOCBI|nr:hypothetical protein DMN91_001957 [Ooceraea biroi]
MPNFTKWHFALLTIFCVSLGHALECYVCTDQEGNQDKCLNTIKTCEQGQDICLTEIRWGSTPYWSQGAKKQFYVSKRCATKKGCERLQRGNMPDCTHIWYQDWKCSSCCQGDRCNYYVILYNMKWKLGSLYKVFTRKKIVDVSQDSKLARCLSTLDLTALGIGSTLGVGVYVLAGTVARNTAGPAVVISFAIAAVASMFAGLCYAEFGARVPRAGSAYVYSYVTMGEFVAFLIGWTLILEYVIGSASVVRGLSTYVDALFNNTMRKAFESAAPIDVNHLSSYPDFFAFGVTLVFSVALAFGAKESSLANNVFTLVNLCVVLFVIIAGSFKADASNWKTKPSCTEEECKFGTGGFAPYGISGIIAGAATCFYGFIGFDCVATTGEEAKNPQRSIPIAIVASLTVVFLAYFGVSAVLTTVLPYYEQNPDAPFPHLFETIGWNWAKWFVSIGAICGLCSRYEESEACEKKGDRDPRTCLFIMKQLVNANKLNHSTKLTSQIVTSLVSCYVVLCACIGALLSTCLEEINAGKAIFIVPLAILVVALLIVLCFIYLQPVSDKELSFSVPLVPFLPGLSIIINIYLMMMLDVMTWIRFAVWMVVGLSIYFLYGVWHSNNQQKKMPIANSNNEARKDSDFSHIT